MSKISKNNKESTINKTEFSSESNSNSKSRNINKSNFLCKIFRGEKQMQERIKE